MEKQTRHRDVGFSATRQPQPQLRFRQEGNARGHVVQCVGLPPVASYCHALQPSAQSVSGWLARGRAGADSGSQAAEPTFPRTSSSHGTYYRLASMFSVAFLRSFKPVLRDWSFGLFD
jgi:hypothetical protein